MPKITQKQIKSAREFAKTPRGQLIFGQALALASEQLKDSEPSNSDDMKFLGEHLFGIWYAMFTPEVAKAIQKNVDEVNEHNKQLAERAQQ